MNTQNRTTWVLDSAHSEFAFKVKHMMISTLTGYFEKFDATALTDGDDFSSVAVEVNVDVNSIYTKNSDRDAHLKSDDFFNAESFPKITFKSKGFKDGKLSGELTMRDVTKAVILDADFNGIAVDPYGQTKAGFEISGEISRKDFNLNWNAITEAGSIVVSDKVKLQIGVQFIKQS
ncbi:MAG: YceI family protein [Bacteroidales bacterium]|nr:YceI family protein [Bacteroidales bacterium]